jgi:uncharacterized protein YggT (Ycf19 family)
MSDEMVREYEQEAEAAEASPIPVFLKIGRVVVWIVYALALLTALLLTLNFMLRLLGANSDNGFVTWVYRSTDRAMEPFRGIFPTQQLGDSSSVLDFSVLFAAIFYFVIAILVDVALRWITNRLRRQERETVALRQRADDAAQEAIRQSQAAQRAAQEAAAREYAAQQAAANQYVIAATAANEAVARQAAREQYSTDPPRAKPAAPQPQPQPGSTDPLPPPAG